METVDVLVTGAGASGMMAALAAARAGASVLLLEQSMTLGGANTAARVGPLMAFHAGEKQIIRGLAQQVIDRLVARGGSPGHIPDPLGVAASITPVDAAQLAQVYAQMVSEWPNLRVLLGATAVGVGAKDGKVGTITAAVKGGLQTLSARVFVDATGDGDLAALCGAPYTVGRAADGLSQPMTLVFTMAGVDFAPIRRAMAERPDQFVLAEDALNQPYTAVSGFFDAVRDARECGELTVQRDRVLLFEGVRPGTATVNMTRVVWRDALSPRDMTAATLEARAQVDEIAAFLKKRIPGFAQSHVADIGEVIGVRESRHIEGYYTLTEADILRQARFLGSVALCAFPIDIHDPAGEGLSCAAGHSAFCYEIPYRVMTPPALSNLLVTGRAISATHEAAASARITPTAMALGEAAGIAAQMAAAEGKPVSEVSIAALQKAIREAGGIPTKDDMEE